MEYFAGLDVSLRSCAVCVVDAKGNVLLEKDLPCEVDVITDCLNSCGHQIERIGFEAGTLSHGDWLARRFRKHPTASGGS